MKIPNLQLPSYPIVKKTRPRNRIECDLKRSEWKVIIDNIVRDRRQTKPEAAERLKELLELQGKNGISM